MAKIYKAVRVEFEAHKQVHYKAVEWDKTIQQVWCALAWHVAKLEKKDLFPSEDKGNAK